MSNTGNPGGFGLAQANNPTSVFHNQHLDDAKEVSSSTTAHLALYFETGDATGTGHAEVVAGVEGGAIKLVTGATGTNNVQWRMNGSPWVLNSRREIAHTVVLKVDVAATQLFALGLHDPVADVLAEATFNGVGFYSNAADGRIWVFVGDGTTATTKDTGKNLVDDTNIELSFRAYRSGKVEFWIDTDRVSTIVDNAPTVNLTRFIQEETTTAASRTLTYEEQNTFASEF